MYVTRKLAFVIFMLLVKIINFMLFVELRILADSLSPDSLIFEL